MVYVTGHKVPKEHPEDKAGSRRAEPMASPSRSSATGSPDRDANLDTNPGNYPRLDRAGSICGLPGLCSLRKPAGTAVTNPTHRSSFSSATPSTPRF